jgi:hypothetical protein
MTAIYKDSVVSCYPQYVENGITWYWIPGTGTVPETELYFGEYKPNKGTMPLWI